MKKCIFEIYPTEDYITGEAWLRFIMQITKINGLFKTWNLIICFKNSYIKYYIESNKDFPSVLENCSEFLIRKVDIDFKIKYILGFPYVLKKNYKNILEIYDKFVSKNNNKIKMVKINIFRHKFNSYLSKTNMFIEKKNKKVIKRRVLGNCSLFNFVSVNFKTHTRFLYEKSVAKYLNVKKIINELSTNKEKAILKADIFPYTQNDLYLNLSNYDFKKHSLVIGSSGTGKSKFMCSFVENLLLNEKEKVKYKIVIIDPHAALENDIGGLKDTQVVDFKTSKNSVKLFSKVSNNIISDVENILDIFKSVIQDRWNSKLERILRYSIHLLLEAKIFNFINLRKLLNTVEFRNKVIKKVEDRVLPNIIEFFKVDFYELKSQSYQEAIAPIISFIDEMELLPAINSKDNIGSVEDVINKNFITIFSLNQVDLGVRITKTIAGFLMQQILEIIQSKSLDEHIILILDEISIIENPIVERFLSESRKYKLSLIIAGQYFNQIKESLKNAIFANVVNYFVFRVSKLDAILLEKNIQMEVAVKNTIINRLKILTEQSDRECIVRIGKNGKMMYAFKGKTLDFFPKPRMKINIVKKEVLEKNKIKSKAFVLETKYSLNKIMRAQSTSRKKV